MMKWLTIILSLILAALIASLQFPKYWVSFNLLLCLGCAYCVARGLTGKSNKGGMKHET